MCSRPSGSGGSSESGVGIQRTPCFIAAVMKRVVPGRVRLSFSGLLKGDRMGFTEFQAKQKLNKLLAVVREYFTKYDGQALCLSDDATFVTLLRALIKDLSITQPGLLVSIPEAAKAHKALMDSYAEGKKPVLFIERILNDIGDTGFLIRQFRDVFPDLKIVVMTTTAEKDRIMLLHEAGADSFVLKPVSRNDMIEKMSVTLRPPGVVRQLLDKARTFIANNISNEAMRLSTLSLIPT